MKLKKKHNFFYSKTNKQKNRCVDKYSFPKCGSALYIQNIQSSLNCVAQLEITPLCKRLWVKPYFTPAARKVDLFFPFYSI